MTPPRFANVARVTTTRRFALAPAEWVTTTVAAVVSTGAYLSVGSSYLARGVVGDLLGFAVLAGVGLATHARVKHEAALCLALIGLVVLASPQWPLALAEPAWWALFFIGLAIYIAIRRRICD